MNGKQYNNIINNTIKNNTKSDRLEIARDVLNNMGVALPQGDLSTISEILQSDDYMYWKSYTAEEAQVFANDGIAAIGITDTDIMLLAADEPLEAIEATIGEQENITKFASNSADNTKYYAYGTFVNNSEQVNVSPAAYARTSGNTNTNEPSGNTSSGNTTSGGSNSNNQPENDKPSGNTSSGNTTSGGNNSNNQPENDEPSGNTSSGNTTSGGYNSNDEPDTDEPSGNTSSGNTTSGDNNSNNQPENDEPSGNTSSGNTTSGGSNSNDEPDTDEPSGNTSSGNTTSGGSNSNDEPDTDEPSGNTSSGNTTSGGNNSNNQPENDEPSGSTSSGGTTTSGGTTSGEDDDEPDIDEPSGNTAQGGTTSCEGDDEPDIDEPSGNTTQDGTTSGEDYSEPDIDEPSGNTSQGGTTSGEDYSEPDIDEPSGNTTQGSTTSGEDYSGPDIELISNGIYYLNCIKSGEYLQNDSGTLNSISGTFAELGITIKWLIEKVDASYVIRSADDVTKCIGIAPDSNTLGIQSCKMPYSLIPSYCKWNISPSLSGGVIMRSVFNSQYLICGTQDITLRNTIGEVGSPIYNRASWRILPVSYSNRELISFDVDDMNICFGDTCEPEIKNTPDNAFWAQLSDFAFNAPENSCVTVDSTNNTITGVKLGSTLVSATHKITKHVKNFIVTVTKPALIIIPGIMGSKLKTTADYGVNKAGDQLWPPLNIDNMDEVTNIESYSVSDAKIVERMRALKFDESGISLCDTIAVAWDNEEDPYDASTNFGVLEQYKTLNTKLYEQFKDTYDVKFFQYDWRLSNEVTAVKLNEYIEKNGYKSVYIVAHSMGGIVASNYLKLGEYQRNKVKRLITLGTPFLGSLDIIQFFHLSRTIETGIYVLSPIGGKWALVHSATNASTALCLGGILGALFYKILILVGIISIYVARALGDLIYNIPSVYELFPNKLYFSKVGGGYASYENKSLKKYTSYSETIDFFKEHLYGFNKDLMNNAERVIDALYSQERHITNHVDSYYIAGTELETITELICYDRLLLKDYSFITHNAGDGTVPEWSATLGYLYPNNTFLASERDHTSIEIRIENEDEKKEKIIYEGLLESNNVLSQVVNIINGNPYSTETGISLLE